jgi:phosphate transport system substrate-binding protein
MKKDLLLGVAVFLLVIVFNHPMSAQSTVVLVGSGSSVPAIIYNKWSEAYNQRKPTIQVRYLPIGTTEGINNLAKSTGDFAAGEAPLIAKDQSAMGEIPSLLIGIVPIYNVPGVPRDLHFSGELLAEIYLGHVKKWNAPQIAKLNPGAPLPDLPIEVVYRPGGKGSNYVFSEFLSKSNGQFRSEVGVSASPKWPLGKPAERSSDMAERVKSHPGSIGYVEAQYAIKDGIPMGSVLNPAGHYVKASPETIANACRSVETPTWDKFGASLVNAPGPDSFPIASFTWLYLPHNLTDPKRAAAMVDFLSWAYSDGQRLAAQDGYTELPPQLLDKVRSKVASLH